MTLPTDPQNTSPNNADDPFGGMDMMAWMESLAKRQGASSDELTTAANIDVPLPPPDSVVTGPGYTPGYDIPKSKTPASVPTDTRPVQAVPVVPPPTPPPQPTPVPVQAAPTPAAAADPSDPFGGMDMMAWMESLAKRQGASSDELTTAANMDIPLPPADTVIDEPGYTPGYDVSTASKSSALKADKPVSAPPPPVVTAAPPPAPIPVPVPVQAAPTPAAAAVDPNDPFGGMDMMAWMESLAKRQGVSSDELTTAANMDIPLPPADTVIDEPGYTPGYDVSTSAKSTAKPAAASVPPAATPEAPIPPPVIPAAPVAAAAPPAPVAVEAPVPTPMAEPISDPFAVGDQMADPMAWLETLAKRQGANPEELMTSANMNIPEPPANTVVDEPGYSDYSPFGGPAPVSEAMDTPSMSSADAAALLGLSDSAAEPNPLNTMDPLAWLESLAAPQATGNTDFTSFATPSSETSEAMEAASALSWLEQLAREAQGFPYEQTETPSGSIITPAAVEDQPEVDISETWVDTTPARADELGGLSDDMSQLQQWLAAQANSLSEVRDLAEDPTVAGLFDEDASDFSDSALAEAAPGEIPDWLREHMPGTTTASPSLATAAPLSEIFDEPAIPADLPAWLLENVSTGTSADPFGFGAPVTDAEPASDLSAEAATNTVSEYDFVAADEPAALDQVSYGDAGEIEDPWVEAFEYEESRRLAGDENELPDWYTEALSRSGDTSVGTLAESTSEAAQPETQSDVLTAGDYPTWLSGLMSDDTEDNETLAAQDQPLGAMDFADFSADQPIMAGDLPSWLTESIPDSSVSLGLSFDSNQFDTDSDNIEMADLPDWLRASAPKDEPKPVTPAAAVPAPTPASQPVPAAPPLPTQAPVSIAPPPAPIVSAPPVPPPPAVPQPAAADVRDFWGAAQSIADSMQSIKTAVPTPPPVPPAPTPVPAPPAPVSVDHGQRLQRARDLVSQGQYRESLTHYQSLIDSEAALDHVIGDMQTIVQAQPKDPSARRLLGDAHLRKGNLQDALDTYRQALDQL